MRHDSYLRHGSDMRHDSYSRHDPYFRQDSIIRQDSNLRQDSIIRQDSNLKQETDLRQNSYLRQSSDLKWERLIYLRQIFFCVMRSIDVLGPENQPGSRVHSDRIRGSRAYRGRLPPKV